jgi:glycosyltransferase involved in cell wall biosynthesis
MEACRVTGLPLIAHFHGYDASVHSVLRELAQCYAQLFREAAAVIAVSRAMERRLLALGADPARLHYNCYGVDCDFFRPGNAEHAPPVLLAVGRFVEKKAPQLTLLAFAEVLRRAPEARLRMIGDGPLLASCRDLAAGLCVAHAVEFLGAQGSEIIRQEMARARCFVQHSVEAADGDCEGTPNVVLEAGACGLPVVSTRHGGIPDVVVEGETGFLVDERDVPTMAAALLRLVHDPALAGALGRAARHRMETHFSAERSAAGLWAIIAGYLNPRLSDSNSL